jgi:squalene-associated FAD-dependent desaturase
MTYDVAVVGGGLAGLAASVQLALNGARVVLIEQANKLGGRAYSYIDRTTGDVVDNGQHVLVGAYRCTLQYLKLVGTRELLTIPEDFHLHFHHPEKGFTTMTFDVLPAGAALAVIRYPAFSLKDRIRLLRAAMKLSKWDQHDEHSLKHLTVSQWMDALRQSTEVRRSFWYPLAVSIMNESPEQASAWLFARSLHATFFSQQSNAKILLPRVGQTELYVDGASSILTQAKTNVLLSTEVTSVSFQKDKAVGVVLKNGKRIKAGNVVVAVPSFVIRRLLPDRLRDGLHLRTEQFRSSPIVSIHLWFNKPVMDKDFVGLIGRRVQWVFNRRRIMRERGKPENYVSAIISAAYEVVNLSKEALTTLAVRDIASAYPSLRDAKLTHSVVIKEKRATFSPTNEVEPYRPSQRTPVENLYLAGDWTDTGLPPTIEGAIMSGFRCAELISQT